MMMLLCDIFYVRWVGVAGYMTAGGMLSTRITMPFTMG